MIFLDENKDLIIYDDKGIVKINSTKFSKNSAILTANSLTNEMIIYLNKDSDGFFVEIFPLDNSVLTIKDLVNQFYKRLISFQSYEIFHNNNKSERELLYFSLFNDDDVSDNDLILNKVDDDENIFNINKGEDLDN